MTPMIKYYAGIGSRKCPTEMLDLMKQIAETLNKRGYILRSGGAEGSDTAFESGAGSQKEIFRPSHATAKSIKLAMDIHPAPQNCNDYVRKLHGRNAQIVLGKNLDTPVEFVVCWTKNENYGGTSMGIKITKMYNIPYYNLYNNKCESFFAWLDKVFD